MKPQKIKREFKLFEITGIPRCLYCKKEFINAIDSKTKRVSKYLWKPDCKCLGDDILLSIG